MKSGIYAITCLATRERYIGSSMNLRARWATHKANLKSGTHVSKRLQAAWNKHGSKAFVFEVIEEVTSEALLIAIAALGKALVAAEQKWMDAESPVYNIAVYAGKGTQKGRKSWWYEGGERVRKAKEKMAAYRRSTRKKPAKGPPKRSAEVRAKISASMKGKHLGKKMPRKNKATSTT